MKVLVYGYGNPGRQDDGLGNAFVNRIGQWVEEKGLKDFFFDSNYQLNIEDADEISDKDLVVFADASTEEIEDFCMSKVDESTKVAFTTHAASPGYIVELCRRIYKKAPPVYLMHIKGYEWEFEEGLSSKAKGNLELAVAYFKEIMEDEALVGEPDSLIKEC
ncbi:MAG: hydrogenase maturation protease [Bacteroidota bacterium]|nr:hydrogenase maturation protease [Bacteroidota bacterium]